MVKYINNTTTQAMINGFKSKFGNNSALKTTSKNFVGAINELKLAIANLPQPQHISQDYSEWYDTNVTSGSYSNLIVTDSTILAISGSSYIKYSEDNGITWQDSNLFGFQDIINSNNILVAGSHSGRGIKYSEDGGKTWQDSNVTNGKYHIRKTDTNILIADSYIEGPDETYKGIKYSEDGGKTWQNSNITNTGMSGYAIGTNIIVASIGGAGIKYSEDGGKTWQNSNITSVSYPKIIITNNGTFLAGPYDSYAGSIRYSEDGGKTWQQSIGAAGTCNNFFIAGNNIITCNNNSNSQPTAVNKTGIKYSEDDGKTWQVPTYINQTIARVQRIYDCVITNGITILSTDEGVIYSEDYGKTWQQSSTSDIDNFVITDTGIVIGCGYNTLIYSEDDGRTWHDTNVAGNGSICIATDGTVITSSNGNGIKYCYVEN